MLIDEGTSAAEGASKLARAIGYSPEEVSMWKRGVRACPLEAQILMADVAKQNVAEVIRDALIERNEGTPRGEKLVSALGKVVSVLGGGVALTLCGPDVMAANLPGLLRCILC